MKDEGTGGNSSDEVARRDKEYKSGWFNAKGGGMGVMNERFVNGCS